MIRTTYQNGVEAASRHFGVRVASIFDMIQHAAGTYGPLVGMGVAGTVAKSALPNVFRGIDRLKAAPTQYLQRVMPSKGANPMARLGKLGLPGVAGSPATAAAFHPTNLPLEPSMLR